MINRANLLELVKVLFIVIGSFMAGYCVTLGLTTLSERNERIKTEQLEEMAEKQQQFMETQSKIYE